MERAANMNFAAAVQSSMRDLLGGLVAAVVLLANIVSFAALMFPGPLAAGASTAIWAMLVGAVICGVWIAWRTSLPPVATGMDSPTGAVLVSLGASTAASALAAGAGVESAVHFAMLIFTGATVLSGVLLLGLGTARWGALLRFVPHFVVAGFLGATGWLLIAGGIRMSTGHSLATLGVSWTAGEAARLVAAAAGLAVLLALRRWVRTPVALPVALLAMVLVASQVLRALGLGDPAFGWYLPSMGSLQRWSPAEALADPAVSLAAVFRMIPEMLSVVVVGLVSLVAKTSSLEVARKSSGDLDRELRAHGLGALVAAPFGGLVSSFLLGSSRLLEACGVSARGGAIACVGVLGVVVLADFDLLALVPLPIAAGLVFSLGWNFLGEAFSKPIAQRAWLQLLLTVAMAAACVRWGYVVGVIGGVIAACLLFAISYARIGVVRQHLSRGQFAGNVTRSAQAMRHLQDHGQAIQIYWLSGHIFFGSSESVFERVRDDLQALPSGTARHVILDLTQVSGADASATMSLAKLRNACRRQGVQLLFASVGEPISKELSREGLAGAGDAPPPFADVNVALAWCEDRLLAEAGLDHPAGDFAGWLQSELGPAVPVADLMPYLARREVGDAQILYREGEPADAIDLIASGRLIIEIDRPGQSALRLRTITTHTVLGEMGFIRRTKRSARVITEGATLTYRLTRPEFERLRREHPALAAAFDDLLLRTLADRIGVSESMALALAPQR